jgi:hypothetical protein
MVAGVYAGDAEVGMRVLQPLRELGASCADLSRQMDFTEVQRSFDHMFPRAQLQAFGQTLLLTELSDEAIEAIAVRALDRPSPRTLVSVMHMGGAVSRPGPEETAVTGRSARFTVSIDGMWTDPARNAEHIAWVRAAAQVIGRHGMDADPAPIQDRLAQVKGAYDPDNFFRLNRNIAPALRGGGPVPGQRTQS